MPEAERAQRNGGCRVACDHDRLHVARNERIGELFRELEHLCIRARAVRMTRGIADVDR